MKYSIKNLLFLMFIVICTVNIYVVIHNTKCVKNEFLGYVINLPDSLLKVNFNGKDRMIYTNSITSEYKLVCLFNSGCGHCIENIDYVDKVFRQYLGSEMIDCYFLTKDITSDAVVLKYIVNKGNLSYTFPIYIDTSLFFYKTNKELCSIPENVILLLDKDSKVILYGKVTEESKIFEKIEYYINKVINI